jgi:hypothetical protein
VLLWYIRCTPAELLQLSGGSRAVPPQTNDSVPATAIQLPLPDTYTPHTCEPAAVACVRCITQQERSPSLWSADSAGSASWLLLLLNIATAAPDTTAASAGQPEIHLLDQLNSESRKAGCCGCST